MNMHEYNYSVKERNRVESEYNNPKWEAIANAYIAIDLHKDQFCRVEYQNDFFGMCSELRTRKEHELEHGM
jgi:hypothetical protein